MNIEILRAMKIIMLLMNDVGADDDNEDDDDAHSSKPADVWNEEMLRCITLVFNRFYECLMYPS